MFESNELKIAMELWGAILCATFLFFIRIGEGRRSDRVRALSFLILDAVVLLLSDAAAVWFRGNETTLGYYAVRISNYLCFAAVCVVEYIAARYLNALLVSEGQPPVKQARYIIEIPSLLLLAYVTVSHFTGFMYTFDEHNRYQRAGGVVVFAVASMVMIIAIIVMIAMNAKKIRRIQSIPFLLSFVMVFAADVVQWLFYGTSLVYMALALGMAILFLAYEQEKAMEYAERQTVLLEDELKLAQQERELADNRTQLMLSQIQPHFLYNTLAAISYLCEKNPQEAKRTTDQFATYLRGNLESLRSESVVFFRQELQVVEAYLSIEKTRFGEDLEVEYDIRYTDFRLPTLSLQPIAENAVRHGICGKEDGGKVIIRTEKQGQNVVITVIDNGIGFEVGKPKTDGRQHVGLESVTERVRLLCDGSLSIRSTPDVGTTVTITLPIKESE